MAVSTSSVAEVSDCPAFEHAVLLGMVSRRRYLRLLSSFILPPAPARIKMVDLGASLIFSVPDGRLVVRAERPEHCLPYSFVRLQVFLLE